MSGPDARKREQPSVPETRIQPTVADDAQFLPATGFFEAELDSEYSIKLSIIRKIFTNNIIHSVATS